MRAGCSAEMPMSMSLAPCALLADLDNATDDLLFDGFELSAPLDSDALALAARDLADPSAFFVFASADTDSLLDTETSTHLDACDFDDDTNDDAASFSSLLSHFTDSDSCSSASDAAISSPLVGSSRQQQQQTFSPTLRRTMVAKSAALHSTTRETSSRSSKKARTTVSAATQKGAPGPTKRPRKHNRIEILKLREQVEQLQSRLAELQMSSDGHPSAQHTTRTSVSASVAAQYARQIDTSQRSVVNATAPRSVWLDLAVEQYATLQQTQSLNRRLRDAVSKQLTLTNSFQTLLHKMDSPQTSELLRELLIPSAECTVHRILDATLPSLFESVTSQFLDADDVVRAIHTANDTASVFHTSRTRQDALRGSSFELITNTPVAGDFHALALSLWGHIVEKKAPLEAGPSGHMKRVQMALPSRDGELLLHGAMVIRKFEQASRVVLAIASAYCASGSDVVFREKGWVIVSDTSGTSSAKAAAAGPLDRIPAPSPAASALFQTYYTLNGERADPTSTTGSSPFMRAPDASVRNFQDRVIKRIGERMREHKLEMQRSLQSSATAFGVSKIEPMGCPLVESEC